MFGPVWESFQTFFQPFDVSELVLAIVNIFAAVFFGG